jgi:hypothetical protein
MRRSLAMLSTGAKATVLTLAEVQTRLKRLRHALHGVLDELES